jgi:hypothetical protein
MFHLFFSFNIQQRFQRVCIVYMVKSEEKEKKTKFLG